MELLIRKPEIAALAKRIFSGLATDGDLERANIEDVRAIKCDTGTVHYRAMADTVELKAVGAERSKRYIASDETVDRMGDIIRVKGWDLRNFLKNPQALWAHNSRALPIGRVTEHEKGEHKGAPALLETITYLEEGISEAAEAVWKLVNAGIIKAVSVGFLPQKTVWPETPEERNELGLGPYGVLFEKQEQLELSNCTIPANPSCLATRSVKTALREMVDAGQITESVARQLVELGEKRTIQVQVPALPEGRGIPDEVDGVTTTTSSTGAVESFVVVEGQLRRVKSASPPPPPRPPTTLELELPDDPRIDQILEEMRQLREEISMLRGEVASSVVRNSPARKDDVRRALVEVVARAGQRIALETH